jgi:hypothetical protein
MDDEAQGHAGAIGRKAGIVQADVVELGAQRQVWKKTNIHAAAEAISKLVGRSATGTGGQTGAAKQRLPEGSQFGGVAERQPGAEEIGVGVEGNATRRGVVDAKVADETEPAIGIVRDGAADTVLVEAAGATQAEIGIPDGGVDGLGRRANGEAEQPQAKNEKSFHRNQPFREIVRVEMRSQMSAGKAGLATVPNGSDHSRAIWGKLAGDEGKISRYAIAVCGSQFP